MKQPRRWRHWTVRSRMAFTIVTLCALALAAAVLAATLLLQNVLTDRIDSQLRTAATAMRDEAPPTGQDDGFEPPGPQPGMPDAPRVYVYDADGSLVHAFGVDDAAALTGLGGLAASTGEATTVEDVDGNSWRVLVEEGDAAGTYVVYALSSEYISAATESLLLIGGGVTLAILLLLAVSAFWVARLGLRPLDRMQATADAIAEGRLDARVTDTDPHTETGRLGAALNTMLARIQAALDASAASEARLRQFLADASHELRTPLTSIKGFAQLYRRGGVPPGPVLDETIGRIEAESKRMGLLLDDLMLLASLDRRRPLSRGPVDLLGVAADAVGDAHLREPGRFIALESLHGSDDDLLEAVDVMGDEPRLRQVLTNLVANALRHTPSDARITVRLGWSADLEGPRCLAQVGEVPALPAAVVEVADTGPGVAPEHAAGVFERLYRVDQGRTRGAEGGSGLGLSIVAAIVAGHGGCVRLCETPGGGATFRVVLPRS
ncbi:sensor histidine kinase [Glycomyces tritici]|uniref:histidine kinase n=1 Tax=Glycomyces tritici TaxID=2665176 RepID=A0ABT7YQE7_9ACTN|nr:HAMP domain-containing sensor histidine kinase [Glycomyces tritici]MDN3240868.1 HAMP domain-containing sensor histidine kinase [Glycomyces tritici]MDN3242929.1 HAMP domain-containing sensor histidine kinase [Glycomyces tritici]